MNKYIERGRENEHSEREGERENHKERERERGSEPERERERHTHMKSEREREMESQGTHVGTWAVAVIFKLAQQGVGRITANLDALLMRSCCW